MTIYIVIEIESKIYRFFNSNLMQNSIQIQKRLLKHRHI